MYNYLFDIFTLITVPILSTWLRLKYGVVLMFIFFFFGMEIYIFAKECFAVGIHSAAEKTISSTGHLILAAFLSSVATVISFLGVLQESALTKAAAKKGFFAWIVAYKNSSSKDK